MKNVSKVAYVPLHGGEGLFALWLLLFLTRNLGVTFQAMIPLLSCKGKESRHRLKKIKNNRTSLGSRCTARSIGHQQLSVSIQLRLTGHCLQKKKPIQEVGSHAAKLNLVGLLFSSKLSISPLNSSFSVSM